MITRYGTLFCLLLAGCMPNAVSYYHPSVEGGKTIAGRCVPVEKRMEFAVGRLPVEAVVIAVQTEDLWNKNYISLSLHPFPLQQIHFESDEMLLRNAKDNSQVAINSVSVKRDDGVETMTAPYAAGRQKGAVTRSGYYFDIEIKYPVNDARRLGLLLPPLIVNGNRIEIPAIYFERRTWIGISPFNC